MAMTALPVLCAVHDWLVGASTLFFGSMQSNKSTEEKKNLCLQEVEAKALVATSVTCMVTQDTTRLSGAAEAMLISGVAKTLGHASGPLCNDDCVTVQTTAFVAKHVPNATTRPAYCVSRVTAATHASVTHTVALCVQDKHVFFANRITGMAVQPSQENQSTGIPQHT